MPLALLKKLPGTMPRMFDSADDVRKVSKLVYAELVEAEFESVPNRYRGPQAVTVTAITELGWITLARGGEDPPLSGGSSDQVRPLAKKR